jgi:hypothetical protein
MSEKVHWTEVKGPSGQPKPPPRTEQATTRAKGSPSVLPGSVIWHFCIVSKSTQSLREVRFPCRVEHSIHSFAVSFESDAKVGLFPEISHRPSWYILDAESTFTVQKPGEYRFQLTTDDDAILWIDQLVVAENRRVGAAKNDEPLTATGTVQLDPGRHKMRLINLHRELDYVKLLLLVQGPDGGPARVFEPRQF